MLIYAAVILPLALWVLFRLSLPPGPYNMDPCGKGTFFPHLIAYSVFGYVQAAFSVFGAAWGISRGLEWHPALVLLFAAINALLFVGFLAFFFESYMESNYPYGGQVGKSNYTVGKYALVLALGFSSVILLIAGALWMAVEVGK